jgi:hypothetical protein
VKPYYQDDHVTLYHGDCLEIMPHIVADVLVTDPPYGISYSLGWEGVKERPRTVAGDETTEVRDAVLGAWGDRPAIVFGSPRLPPLGLRCPLVWHKPGKGMGDVRFPWKPDYEVAYVLGAGWDSATRSSSVIRVVPDNHTATLHPTQKPTDLMRQLISKCPPGVILDPFAGSGSTLRAAKDLGRKAIGIEIDESYCEIIVKRLAQEVLL